MPGDGKDAGIFGRHDMFHDYLAHYQTEDLRVALIRLFRVLDTPKEKRDPYLKADLAVMQAYAFSTKMTESDCVAALFRLYEEMVKK